MGLPESEFTSFKEAIRESRGDLRSQNVIGEWGQPEGTVGDRTELDEGRVDNEDASPKRVDDTTSVDIPVEDPAAIGDDKDTHVDEGTQSWGD